MLLIFGILNMNQVLWRSGTGNLVQCLHIPFILGAVFVGYGIEWLKNVKSPSRYLCITLISLLPIIIIVHFCVDNGYESGSIGALRESTILFDYPKARLNISLMDAEWLKEIISFIQANTEPKEPIFSLPLGPIFYFLTERRNPTFWEWILPGWWLGLDKSRGELEKEIIRELETAGVKLVLISNIMVNNNPDSNLEHYAPIIYQYVNLNFDRKLRIGWWEGYIKKEFEPIIEFASDRMKTKVIFADGLFYFEQLQDKAGVSNILFQTIPSSLSFKTSSPAESIFESRIKLFLGKKIDEGTSIRIKLTLDQGTNMERVLIDEEVEISLKQPFDVVKKLPLPIADDNEHIFSFVINTSDMELIPEAVIGWIDPKIVIKYLPIIPD